jgi:hypothetical protein
MDMETSLQILVIIISLMLGGFLIVSIVALVKIIKLLRVLKNIADKAEVIADKANSITEVMQKTAGPVAIGRFFTHLSETVFHKDKTTRKGE